MTAPLPNITVQPYHLGTREPFAWQGVIQEHQEALYGYGEYTLFFLMWTPIDFAAGLVDECPLCAAGRIAAAYKQPIRSNCPNCYGTRFNGGYRAKIVRPAIWADDNKETAQTQRGFTQTAALAIETTNDFTLHTYDYAVRSNNDRYRASQSGDPTYLRTGFGQPVDADSPVGINVASMRLEEPASVVYTILPTAPSDVLTALAVPVDQVTPEDFSSIEDIQGPLIV